MSDSEDWVRDLVARGLLTGDQVEHVRRLLNPGETAPPTPSPGTPSTTIRPPGIVTCRPCGQIFTVSSLDSAAMPACPKCGLPTSPVSLGGRLESVAAPAAPDPAPPAGRSFGRYLLRRELGRGGMGVVFEAWDTSLRRAVALKMLSSPGCELDAAAVERLMREARAAARLAHPGIVAVHEIGEQEGRHYFTMDLFEGPSLETRLVGKDRWTAFPLQARLEALRDVAEALAHAHAHGIVHRDLKPSNVLFGADDRARLTDFGLARDLESVPGGLTMSGVVLGTPHYMSPEQAAGESRRIGPASDVFSFGVVLFRALSDRLPFPGEGMEALQRIIHDHPGPPRRTGHRVPRPAQAVCLKCLEKDGSARYPDGAALAAEMKRLASGQAVEASLARARRRARGRARAGSAGDAPTAALRLLELGRPSLERAHQAQYEPVVDEDEQARRLESAMNHFSDAVRIARGLPLGHYLLGRAHELRGDIAAAEASFEAALREDSEFGPAHYWLGRVKLIRAWVCGIVMERQTEEDSRRHAGLAEATALEARRCFDAALARGSGFDEEIHVKMAEAMTAWARRDGDAMRQICAEGLARFPSASGREEFHWMLSLCPGTQDCLPSLERALQIRPRYALALYTRSREWRRRGDWEAVRRDLLLVVRTWPRFAPGWISLGNAAPAGTYPPDALQCFDAAVSADPRFEPGWTNRAAARFRKSDWAGVVADCTEAIRLNPLRARAWVGRAYAIAKLGRPAESIPDLREAYRLDPDAAVLNDLGVAHLEVSDWAGAERVFDECVGRFPEHVKAWNNRGVARLNLGKLPEALADVREALRREPGYPEAHHNAAQLLLRLGDAADAERHAGEAIRLRPGYANAWKRRGLARLALGRAGEAAADLDEAIRLNAADGESKLGRARARAANGDRSGAAEDARAAAALAEPGGPERAEALEFLASLEP